MGMGEYEDFQVMSAAADTDMDKLRSLSDLEPSLTPLLTRIVSAGINLTVAAGLFKRAVGLRRMAMSGKVDPEALAALNKAGDEFGCKAIGDEAVAAEDVQSSGRSVGHPSGTIEVQGFAQTPKTYPWALNAGGRTRTLDEARALAESRGVTIPDDIKFVAVDGASLPRNTFARYLNIRVSPDEVVSWEEFYNRFEQIPIALSREILNSDEAILAVIAHEMHELNSLRVLFEERGGHIPAVELRRLVQPNIPGNLHDHAWDVADALIEKFRSEGVHD